MFWRSRGSQGSLPCQPWVLKDCVTIPPLLLPTILNFSKRGSDRGYYAARGYPFCPGNGPWHSDTASAQHAEGLRADGIGMGIWPWSGWWRVPCGKPPPGSDTALAKRVSTWDGPLPAARCHKQGGKKEAGLCLSYWLIYTIKQQSYLFKILITHLSSL